MNELARIREAGRRRGAELPPPTPQEMAEIAQEIGRLTVDDIARHRRKDAS